MHRCQCLELDKRPAAPIVVVPLWTEPAVADWVSRSRRTRMFAGGGFLGRLRLPRGHVKADISRAV